MLFGAGHPVAVKPCRHTLWEVHAGNRACCNIFSVEDAKVGGHCGKVGGIHHDICAKFTWSCGVVGNNGFTNGGARPKGEGLVAATFEVVANDAVETKAHRAIEGC